MGISELPPNPNDFLMMIALAIRDDLNERTGFRWRVSARQDHWDFNFTCETTDGVFVRCTHSVDPGDFQRYLDDFPGLVHYLDDPIFATFDRWCKTSEE